MRLATFVCAGPEQAGPEQAGPEQARLEQARLEQYGCIRGHRAFPVAAGFRARYPDLRSVIAAGDLAALDRACDGPGIGFGELVWRPPIPDPAKIFCAGLNFAKPSPVAGMARPRPEKPVLFARHPDSFVGHGQKLERPDGLAAETFDYEGEVVAVIGQPGRHIPPHRAAAHVLGYAPLNDGSVRAWMQHSIHAGKNFFASGSWGPWITTVDEAGPFARLALTVRVNGHVVQTASMQEAMFDLPGLIAYISHVTPLNAGDLIATGSPDGTGSSFSPPRYLKAGDTVEVAVSALGTLKNSV